MTKYFALIMCLIQCSCASINHTPLGGELLCGEMTTAGPSYCPKKNNTIYIGVRKDIEAIYEYDGGLKAFPIFDLPFSLALDTVYLPISVTYTLIQ